MDWGATFGLVGLLFAAWLTLDGIRGLYRMLRRKGKYQLSINIGNQRVDFDPSKIDQEELEKLTNLLERYKKEKKRPRARSWGMALDFADSAGRAFWNCRCQRRDVASRSSKSDSRGTRYFKTICRLLMSDCSNRDRSRLGILHVEGRDLVATTRIEERN